MYYTTESSWQQSSPKYSDSTDQEETERHVLDLSISEVLKKEK